MRIGFFISFILVLLMPSAVSAQSIQSFANPISSSAFSVSTSPQYPKPFGQVTLSFLSATLNLANSILRVSVNAKQIYKGSVQSILVNLGGTGKPSSIIATISSGGIIYKKSVNVQPEDVSLVLEPLSLVPPLYKGGAQTPLGGSVRVVAMANLRKANGAQLNPNTLSYSWVVDGVRIANSSGIGRNVVRVASPLQYRSRSVSVIVRSTDGALVGGDTTVFYAQNPTTLIYKKGPLLGIRFDNALSGTFSVGNTESSLYAVPFFIPLTTKPLMEWFLNGSYAQQGNTITLRPVGSGRGSSSLSFTASTDTNVSASANLELDFGSTRKTNFFGL